ncbi:hypothetical protein V865_004034 [Kwoniella europaea PYCC6329]|uniref:Magnesium transporter n=1 Tax=Kwoniella europaea PYCC6329 TaxID=1423913 RepID=A0AAX4KIU5_9TREE
MSSSPTDSLLPPLTPPAGGFAPRNDNSSFAFFRQMTSPPDFAGRIVIVKNFTRLPSTKKAFEELMFPSGSVEVPRFLEKLRDMMRKRSDGDCIWIRVYGRDMNLIAGITELCGLPYDELMQHPWAIGPEDQSPHFERAPSSTSIHFPVYGTPNSIRNMVLQAQVHPSYRRIELPEDPKASRLKLELADVNDMIKTGFISIYMIPSVNVLITTTTQSYVCPATRMTEGPLPKDIINIIDEENNAEVLGLSFIQQAVRRAENTVKDIAEIVRSWENEARHSVSTTRAEEVHRIILHLHTFGSHLRQLQTVHEELIQHFRIEDDQEDERRQVSLSHAAIFLRESEKGRCRAAEDLQDLMDRCKSLETFCFNMLSSRANDSMERLAIVTIVFLPLTFIASYFSMGFKDFTVLDRTPSFFWKISVPLSIFFFLIFAYSTLKRFFKFAFNLVVRNVNSTQTTRSFQRLKHQWWQRPINRARRDRLLEKLKGIFRTFRAQDLPPPSYMPREQFPPYIPENSPMARPMGGYPIYTPLGPSYMSFAPRPPSQGIDNIV